MIEKRPALGKGLSALIPDAPEPNRHGPVEVDIDLLTPNEKQPRLQMDDAKLEELAQSIRENGVIQPILVQKIGDLYRIIAGERRWRAAQRAGLLKVPVVVRRSGRVSAARRRLRFDTRSDCRRGRKRSQLGRKLRAVAEAGR
jgi:ParB/Sulfiredoxin domain